MWFKKKTKEKEKINREDIVTCDGCGHAVLRVDAQIVEFRSIHYWAHRTQAFFCKLCRVDCDYVANQDYTDKLQYFKHQDDIEVNPETGRPLSKKTK
jgi:hypothetical protein